MSRRTARTAALHHRLKAAAAAVTVAALSSVCLAASSSDHGLDFAGMAANLDLNLREDCARIVQNVLVRP